MEDKNGSSKDNVNMFFNQKAVERLQSPEDMEKYLHITNPGAWIMIIACAVLLGGLLIWAFFGSVAERATLSGVIADTYVICVTDADTAIKIAEGAPAYIDGKMYEVGTVFTVPVDEESLSDFARVSNLTAHLILGENEKAYPIFIEIGENSYAEDSIVEVAITLDKRSPVEKLFGR
jgi:hypothetical protein